MRRYKISVCKFIFVNEALINEEINKCTSTNKYKNKIEPIQTLCTQTVYCGSP